MMTKGSSSSINGTSYLQMMSHTAAVNIGLFFGITGRIIPTSSACTSGSHAIGYGAETIRHGQQDMQQLQQQAPEEVAPSERVRKKGVDASPP